MWIVVVVLSFRFCTKGIYYKSLFLLNYTPGKDEDKLKINSIGVQPKYSLVIFLMDRSIKDRLWTQFVESIFIVKDVFELFIVVLLAHQYMDDEPLVWCV